VVLHLYMPIVEFLTYPLTLLGVPLVASGIILNLAADRSFKNQHTTVKPFQESNVLVTDGVFGFSRHPMYLGFVLILTGTAILLGSLTPFAAVVCFTALMEKGYIRIEEQMLAARFGDDWFGYADRVRKWIWKKEAEGEYGW